jgi:hypothetical protein
LQQPTEVCWKLEMLSSNPMVLTGNAATQANPLLAGSKIRATAADVPGNETIEEKTL